MHVRGHNIYPWIHESGTLYISARSLTFTKKIIRTVFIDYYMKGYDSGNYAVSSEGLCRNMVYTTKMKGLTFGNNIGRGVKYTSGSHARVQMYTSGSHARVQIHLTSQLWNI